MPSFVDKARLQEFGTKLTIKFKEIFGHSYAPIQSVNNPLIAANASAMTDTTKTYIYTGSEAGYINGDLYYYDGSDWMTAGAYNGTYVDSGNLNTYGKGLALPHGTIHGIEGGSTTITKTFKSVSFASNFENVPYVIPVYATTQSTIVSGDFESIKVRNITTSGFEIAYGGSSDNIYPVMWIAVDIG